MFLEKIKSEGLAHLSYILGDKAEAVVIDPRRDCGVYLDIAAREGAQITRIYETHRNEDYVVGSIDLARRTGATIHHGGALDFKYGNAVSEGDSFDVGDLRLQVLETPGHTMESISLVITDRNFGETPVGVFTGDALFVGDVGRTDFYPDRAREVAGMLYDSIFGKLLPLGDQTILYPGHGAGSVCGDNMASREFSTLGHEKRNNPVLQKSNREAFIEYKVAEDHGQPSYFRKMEQYNKEGAPPLDVLPRPRPMNPQQVSDACENGAIIVDLRSPESFSAAFIPNSLSMPLKMLPAYAGYLLDYEHDLLLVPETHDQIALAVQQLVRMGYDRLAGYLKGGLNSWEASGRIFDTIGSVHAGDLEDRLKRRESFTLLDVRKNTEFKKERLAGSTHIFLGNLRDRLDELDRDRPAVTFCGSGIRAIIAASILKRHGFQEVENCLGSMEACINIGCALQRG